MDYVVQTQDPDETKKLNKMNLYFVMTNISVAKTCYITHYVKTEVLLHAIR